MSTTSEKRLVLVGTPSDAAAEAHWAEVQRWAARHGWEITCTVPEEGAWCAVATEEVLDGTCTPEEAMAMHAIRGAGIRCVSVYEAPALLAEAVSGPPIPV
ncbi:hypothetical protein [Rhodococcus chondri]|uniref:Uncharacterized protein n=1 Tax=Rhodococcus chondri TaxID=3065941 RepID=A0ABU7JQE6_9NOCA|nr:hypothetical protein [Rhodococcus sp. CC-R104]MEE2031987.1 hypothetical protein [Rhodococcus sp. CC-R104]